MHRRTRRTLWVGAAVLVLLAVAVFLRSKAPPEAARNFSHGQNVYNPAGAPRDFLRNAGFGWMSLLFFDKIGGFES